MTLHHAKMNPPIKFGIPTSNNIRDMLRTRLFQKTRPEVEVKVIMTRKEYVTLRHPKMHPHTKFGIPTSNNIGDMHRTRSRMGRRTDGQCDYYCFIVCTRS